MGFNEELIRSISEARIERIKKMTYGRKKINRANKFNLFRKKRTS
ncbi:hypothetical protein [Virgibacillus oceani]|uniref:Uncharacterized protein n=1 Tax=Virgibacillus oceani TaxID=1479511 RepID=A0A917HIL0_9BACI|nr:hypothetical protein [Virgibacillus oceani]GGG80335.1 hypothetical protein GCM10011398_27130 [Virgibacillus oceani]